MDELELYKKMYATLCGAISEALDLPAAREAEELSSLLQGALERAEELYIDHIASV